MSLTITHTASTPSITIIFVNYIGDTLRVVADSFNTAYMTADRAGFEIYDWEVMEGEEYAV